METQVSTLQNITVRKRKPSAMKGMKKFFAYIGGGVYFFIGFCLLFTIIGIIPGIFMMVGSLGVIAAAGDKYQVSCPHCKKKMIVGKNQEDFKCKRCSEPVIINWIDYKGR